MSIFKKIFGGGNFNETKPINQCNSVIKEQISAKRTIFDFFNVDLKNIPDDSFIEAETETNVVGETVQNFRKTLGDKECGIFDTVEVKIIGGKIKNVTFLSFHPESVKLENLKRLIDDLYLIHGQDSNGSGKFTSKDAQDYKDSESLVFFGRSWSDYPKYKYPVAVGRDEDYVSITIWGIEME